MQGDPRQVPYDMRPHRDAVHAWFSLSYSNYAVLPRTLLQSMPDEWQKRFVELLEELHTEFAHVEQADGYEVTAGSWLYANECSSAQLKAAGVKIVETDDEDGTDDETCYVNRDGDEIDGHQYVFVPGTEPIPHYSRGRTYVPPASVLKTLRIEPGE
ncbi:hypothetical protein [Actinomadura rubrisoli]|uniref:Uncharacterized protein n=1 Tax=Actinomadura rubrisoli TaxID=2530368 RepID=A0A4R5CCA8_9ACTN|nr:hypothetical protein [Actinomadura rubrisoli]TDD97618.1 hypothetical protein E1298_00885 [Actinomadura rubrisoli]